MKNFVFYFYLVLLVGAALVSAADMPTNDGWHGLLSVMVGAVLALPWSPVIFVLTTLATPLMGKQTDTLTFWLLWVAMLVNGYILWRFARKK